MTVADSRGEKTERELRVRIRSNAKAEMAPIATTVQVNAPTVVRPLSRIVGGSGSYALVDASVQSGAATAAVNAGAGTVEIEAKEPGVTVIAVTARDTGTDSEITGTVRVTAVESRQKLGLPPLRAFVTSGPLVALVLSGDRAIDAVRSINGATDGVAAAPGSIRGDLCLSNRENAVHASDTLESAARELRVLVVDRDANQ